jgi:hypothetical protein
VKNSYELLTMTVHLIGGHTVLTDVDTSLEELGELLWRVGVWTCRV